MFLRNATSQIIRFGPFLDSTDGVTPEVALTITQADMQLSKDGGVYAQKNAAGNATHDTDGWYSTTLDATDSVTNGELIMQVNVSGALPVWVKYYVVPTTSYDALTTNGLNNVAATEIVSAGAITTLSGAVANVTTVATTTTNTDMRGTDSALLAASYTAPDNAGITSNGSAIAALNNITAADVWSSITRTLTSGANIVLAKGVGVTGFNDITAASVLAAGDIDGYTLEESQKLVLAASAGILSGAATTTVTITAVDGSKARLTATVDGDGNRSAVIKDVTG